MTSFSKRKPRQLLSIAVGAAGALAAACSDGSDHFNGSIMNSPDGGEDSGADGGLSDSSVGAMDSGDGADVGLPPDRGDAADAEADASRNDAANDAQDQ